MQGTCQRGRGLVPREGWIQGPPGDRAASSKRPEARPGLGAQATSRETAPVPRAPAAHSHPGESRLAVELRWEVPEVDLLVVTEQHRPLDDVA